MLWKGILTGVVGAGGVLLLVLVFMRASERSPEGRDDDVKRQQAVHELKSLAEKVTHYASERGRLPTHLAELVPKFLPESPKDPFGNAYRIVSGGPDALFLYYYGKDGRPKGTTERDMDVVVRVVRRGASFHVEQ